VRVINEYILDHDKQTPSDLTTISSLLSILPLTVQYFNPQGLRTQTSEYHPMSKGGVERKSGRTKGVTREGGMIGVEERHYSADWRKMLGSTAGGGLIS
jgi:hypothetical protein